MALKRGDIVRVAEGKPRPAVVIQSDRLATADRLLLCPLTSVVLDAPIYRPTVEMDEGNHLLSTSQLMIDQIGAARRSRIDGMIGRLSDADIERLDTALLVMLDLVQQSL